MTRFPAFTTILLLLCSSGTYGQVTSNTIPETGQLSIEIKNISFIKNNEYVNPVIEGYTMLGSLLRPELIYSPSTKITMHGGIHLLKYSGTGKFSQIKPVLSTTFNLSEKSSLTLGSLSGSDKHRLYDPIFNSERIYTNYTEDGFQFTGINDNLFSDMWISWENYIFKGDSTREVFSAGESFRFTSPSIADALQFEVPVQILFKHFGGQISSYPERVETYFNLAVGLRMNIDIARQRAGRAGIEYLRFVNSELRGKSITGISNGYASWLRLHYDYKALYIGVAYWKAHNFFAPNGNAIYGSVSDYQPEVILPYRNIITNSFYLKLLPESYFELLFGVETYYDIDNKRLDNSITLHLNFEKLFRIAALKN